MFKKYNQKQNFLIPPSYDEFLGAKLGTTAYDPVMLLKVLRKLFLLGEKNLSPIQKLRLNQIFYEFDYLGFLKEAWTTKEDFCDAMDTLDIKLSGIG